MTRRLFALLALLSSLVVLPPPAGVAAQSAAMATITPTRGPIGTRVTIAGAGWPGGRPVTVTFGAADYFEWAKGSVAPDGTLSVSATVPRLFTPLSGATTTVTPGDYTINIVTAPGADRGTLAAAVKFTVVQSPPAPLTISWRFQDYYYQHDGGRLLGAPLSEVRFEGGRRVQYFEKGRIEDHDGEPGATGAWRFLYGRLAADLATSGGPLAVGGVTSNVTYATLNDLALPERRQAPPANWQGVAQAAPGEAVFVPVDSTLQPAPGHYVPARFWEYINQAALFPAGWVHDIGLPLTEAVPATVTKTVNGERVARPITVQLFERTVLTDDPANPAAFQIERANVGADYLQTARGQVIPGDVALDPAFRWMDPRMTSDGLPVGMAAPAWEWLSLPDMTVKMESEIGTLQQLLEQEGWRVTGQSGAAAAGTIEAVKGQRLQTIEWWHGARPGSSGGADQPDLGTRMRVLVGQLTP